VLVCPCCRRRFNSNEADVLTNIPEHAADAYPVETTYALRNSESHLNRHATEAFSSIVVTYGNGELCSKLLFNAINRDYIRRIKGYYSIEKERFDASRQPAKYIEKDGEFMRQHPPLGETIRDMFDTALSSQKNRRLENQRPRSPHTRDSECRMHRKWNFCARSYLSSDQKLSEKPSRYSRLGCCHKHRRDCFCCSRAHHED